MRLASWIHRGREGFGQVVDGGVVDAVPRLDGRYPTLAAVIDHYDTFMGLGLSSGEKRDLEQYLRSL